ncbi:MAG TPA: hypothetical protein VER96_09360 [Polyangiaceae bacterium]|nr:hypothetical protein [Polyangiaceae bacterium]
MNSSRRIGSHGRRVALAGLTSLTLFACGSSSDGPSANTGGMASHVGGAGPSVAGSAGTPSTSAGSSGSAAMPGASGSVGSGGSNAAGGSAPAATGGNPSSAGSSSGGGGNVAGGPSNSGGTGGDMPLVYGVENTGTDCPAPPAPPAFSALTTAPELPDPFLLSSGTRIASRDQWRCRRAEIASQMQYWVSGPKGAPPADGALTATFSGGKLTVVIKQGSTSITLSSTITTPSGTGPFPLVIGMNTPTGSITSNIFTSRGVATMVFTSSQLVPDSLNVPRGGGDYFKMYPDTNAGAMIEWAWGISRLIDGLYKTQDQNQIDVKRIAVTGCSFQGKMSLYAGAFDERIALVIPEESGGGGEASWRVMASQTGTEDLEAAQGTAWYATNLKQFKNPDAKKLPVDMHELVAMVAPRAVLTIANTSIDRLGSEAGYVSMKAAGEVYKALGISDRIGYSQNATGTHCAFPSVQAADVGAFVDKFLVGKSADTAIAKTPYKTDLSKWYTWTTPTLK